MTVCKGQEPGQVHGHYCVGEEGHSGLHWCLLGHVWDATENDTTEEK